MICQAQPADTPFWLYGISAIAFISTGTNITLYLHVFQTGKYYNIYYWWNKQYTVYNIQAIGGI